MLEWPRPIFGPTIWNRLGKPFTVVPLYAVIPSRAHTCASVSPCLPVTCRAIGGATAWEPVATMIASTPRTGAAAVAPPAGGSPGVGPGGQADVGPGHTG